MTHPVEEQFRLGRLRAVVTRLGDDVVPDFPTHLQDTGETEMEFVGRVLREEGITYSDFRSLDESPGNYQIGGYEGYHGAWHHRLRRWRNSDSTVLEFAKEAS